MLLLPGTRVVVAPRGDSAGFKGVIVDARLGYEGKCPNYSINEDGRWQTREGIAADRVTREETS